eukprot:scaffold167444_cov31-Tisochrysis_lutea.AAC.4
MEASGARSGGRSRAQRISVVARIKASIISLLRCGAAPSSIQSHRAGAPRSLGDRCGARFIVKIEPGSDSLLLERTRSCLSAPPRSLPVAPISLLALPHLAPPLSWLNSARTFLVDGGRASRSLHSTPVAQTLLKGRPHISYSRVH